MCRVRNATVVQKYIFQARPRCSLDKEIAAAVENGSSWKTGTILAPTMRDAARWHKIAARKDWVSPSMRAVLSHVVFYS